MLLVIARTLLLTQSRKYSQYILFYYLIIGLLDVVRDLTVNITSTNTVILSWSTPYTLDNTYINGYNITITNTLTNEIEKYFTESLQLSYQSGSNKTNHCTEIKVNILLLIQLVMVSYLVSHFISQTNSINS